MTEEQADKVLKELEDRAHRQRLDNLTYPEVKLRGFRPPLEPVDEGTFGIAMLLGVSSLVLLGVSRPTISRMVPRILPKKA